MPALFVKRSLVDANTRLRGTERFEVGDSSTGLGKSQQSRPLRCKRESVSSSSVSAAVAAIQRDCVSKRAIKV